MIEKINIKERVHNYYWQEDLNCATTILKVLAEMFAVDLEQQLIDAAIGMHGAGKFGAQCGLVEGSLLFLGIYGRKQDFSKEDIIKLCYNFADQFEHEYGSLICKDLRPAGFKKDNPPHLCEEITNSAAKFASNYIKTKMI